MSKKKQLKLISWKVNMLRVVLKKDFFDSVTGMDPDILMLQETKLQEDQRSEQMIRFGDYESFWNYSTVKKGYSGVASYTRITPDTVTTQFGNPEYDGEGRIIRMDFEKFVLFNIYFPNGQMSDERLSYKLAFYDWFLDYAQKLRDEGRSIIVTGDFNTAHNDIDLKNPTSNAKRSGFLRIERDLLYKMVDIGYVDTFRHFYPEAVKYSWWSYRFNARKNNAGWRIDYFFVTRDLIENGIVKDAFIDNEIFGSDHCPVGLMVAV